MRAGAPDRFRPSAPVTQGEVIEALYSFAGSPAIRNQQGQLLQGRDAALAWMQANRIAPIGGRFNLDNAITRQDVAFLFSRMVSVLRLRAPAVRTAPSFADASQIDSAARSAVTDIYRAGVMSGRTTTTFVPLGQMTRAEFATALHRFADVTGR